MSATGLRSAVRRHDRSLFARADGGAGLDRRGQHGAALTLVGPFDRDLDRLATRFAYALVPLGFGMWLAHYSFHFVTSYEGVVPTVQRFLLDRGWPSARIARLDLHRLRSGARLAAAARDRLSRSGSAALALHGVSHRPFASPIGVVTTASCIRALGDLDRAVIRPGHLDRVSTDANAWNDDR